jgi:hypothetical protein
MKRYEIGVRKREIYRVEARSALEAISRFKLTWLPWSATATIISVRQI